MTDRLLAYMVTRNEAGRYLDACLAWACGFVDAVSVYDDRSTDNTVEVAVSHQAPTLVRPEGVPSFVEHEGRFRAAAWAWFEEALAPEPGDWVLALDADEFLVCQDGVRSGVDAATEAADQQGANAVRLAVPEVFEVTAGPFLAGAKVRTDGAWGTIAGTRLFRYRPGGIFRDRAMGCGAEPTYVADQAQWAVRWPALSLLHLGYAHPADRQAKFIRYTSLANHGHNDAHVRSIVTPPTLAPWPGPWPPVWRGVR